MKEINDFILWVRYTEGKDVIMLAAVHATVPLRTVRTGPTIRFCSSSQWQLCHLRTGPNENWINWKFYLLRTERLDLLRIGHCLQNHFVLLLIVFELQVQVRLRDLSTKYILSFVISYCAVRWTTSYSFGTIKKLNYIITYHYILTRVLSFKHRLLT